MSMAEAAAEFLSHQRIAVAGVSGTGKHTANFIYEHLRKSGYTVFAVNPNADVVEGDRSYHSLADIEGGVEAVVVMTHPRDSLSVVRDCARLGIERVWLHRAFGDGSVSAEAVAFCQDNGIAVIDGGCPRMYLDPVDVPHKCMHFLLKATHKLPNGAKYQPLARTH